MVLNSIFKSVHLSEKMKKKKIEILGYAIQCGVIQPSPPKTEAVQQRRYSIFILPEMQNVFKMFSD